MECRSKKDNIAFLILAPEQQDQIDNDENEERRPFTQYSSVIKDYVLSPEAYIL